jgi:hypothetical protein
MLFEQRCSVSEQRRIAIGRALYALLTTASSARSDAAIQRGSAYLLSTQRADGSRFVQSRSPKFQPYFEGGFPYGTQPMDLGDGYWLRGGRARARTGRGAGQNRQLSEVLDRAYC